MSEPSLHDPPPALDLLPEEPLSASELFHADGVRLTPLIETLTAQLQHYLHHGRRHLRNTDRRGAQPMVIALHGALGDGKSTVLDAVRRRLDKAQWRRDWRARLRWHWSGHGAWPEPQPRKLVPVEGGDRRWPRLMKLDLSRFRPEPLEHYFWTVILLRSPAFWTWLAVLVWFWNLVQLWDAGSYAPLVQVGGALMATAYALAVPAANLVASAAQRWLGIEPAWLDGLVRRLIVFRPCWPDVIFVDDLDRCRVEAQRSLLWALHHRARTLGMAVVIAFDESDLLASDPSPESPEELLRKLVLTTYRVPPRTVEDAAWMAITQCQRLARHNTEHRFGNALRDPRLAASLATLCVVLGQINPRRLQTVLHEALLASLSGAGRSLASDDVLEVIRAQMLLACLQQEAPTLCRDGITLAHLLEDPSPERRAGWLAPLPDKSVRRGRLERLVSMGPALTPHPLTWHALLACDVPRDAASLTHDDARAVPSAGRLEHPNALQQWLRLRNWSEVLTSVVDEHGHFQGEWPRRLWRGIPRDGLSLLLTSEDLRLGWTLWCAMWSTWQPQQRLRACEWWQQVVLADAGLADEARDWRIELWRMWLTDAEALASMPSKALEALFAAAGRAGKLWLFVASLPSISETVHQQLWELVVALRAQDGVDVVDETWIRRAVKGRWPAQGIASRAASTTGTTESELLANIWPLKASQHAARALALAVSDSVRTYADALGPTARQFALPALQAVMASSYAHLLTATEWVDALTPLLKSDGVWQPRSWAQGPLPVNLATDSAWTNRTLRELVASETRWLAAVCLLFAAAHDSNVTDSREEWRVTVLTRLLNLGADRHFHLPNNLLDDDCLQSWLARPLTTSAKTRMRQVRAWLRCQLTPLRHAIAASGGVIALGAWLRFLKRMAAADAAGNRIILRRAIPGLGLDSLPLRGRWEMHDGYEWPVLGLAHRPAHRLDFGAALRWLNLAVRGFDELSIHELSELTRRALKMCGIECAIEGPGDIAWSDVFRRVPSLPHLMDEIRQTLIDLQSHFQTLPTHPDHLPAVEPEHVQVWLRRWAALLPVDLPEDDDEADARLRLRIDRWAGSLHRDSAPYRMLLDGVYQLVLSTRAR